MDQRLTKGRRMVRFGAGLTAGALLLAVAAGLRAQPVERNAPRSGDPSYGYPGDYNYGYDDEPWSDPGYIDEPLWDHTREEVSVPLDRPDFRNFGWHYDWDPVHGKWRSDHGYYGQEFSFDAPNDFGWHFDWNPRSREWTSDYGWHRQNWDFDPARYDYREEDFGRAQASAGEARAESRIQARQARTETGHRHLVRGEVTVVGRELQPGGRINGFARVDLRAGADLIFNLGNRDPAGAGVNPGDQVVLRGRVVRRDGGEVLIPEQVQIDGRRYRVREREELPVAGGSG